jgi:hypothetical protein
MQLTLSFQEGQKFGYLLLTYISKTFTGMKGQLESCTA